MGVAEQVSETWMKTNVKSIAKLEWRVAAWILKM
jgi:hypothetical protein